MNGALLMLTPVAPLLLALAALWRPCRSWVANGAALALVPAVLLLAQGPGAQAEYDWWLLGSRLGLDAIGHLFLAFSVVLWLAAALHIRHSIVAERRLRFALFFLVTLSGNLGLILAQDGVSFYLFFALMSFAAYGLVIHDGSAAALRAGRIYLISVVAGELCLFAALLLLAQAAGGSEFERIAQVPLTGTVLFLLLLGFGLKCGTLLLHVWMPLAYGAAPIAAAVVLAGAMVKAGLLGWLRFLPLGGEASGWGWLFVVIGFASAFYGVVIGLLQRQPKVILAYSSISQMGVMTALIGVGLLAPEQWPALLVALLIYAMHHALVKGTLFLGIGAPLGGMILAAAIMAGLPPLSGALAKAAFKQAALPMFDLGLWLSLSSFATALLMLHLLMHLPRGKHAGAFWGLLVVTLSWPLLRPELREQMATLLQLDQLLLAVWPLLAAVLIYVVWRRSRFAHSVYEVDAGDLLTVYTRAVCWLGSVLQKRVETLNRGSERLRLSPQYLSAFTRCWQWLAAYEDALLRWPVAAVLLLGMVGLIVLTFLP